MELPSGRLLTPVHRSAVDNRAAPTHCRICGYVELKEARTRPCAFVRPEQRGCFPGLFAYARNEPETPARPWSDDLKLRNERGAPGAADVSPGISRQLIGCLPAALLRACQPAILRSGWRSSESGETPAVPGPPGDRALACMLSPACGVAPDQRIQTGKTRAVPVCGIHPELPNRGPTEGRSSAGGDGRSDAITLTLAVLNFSTLSFANRLPRCHPSTARPASKPGRERCSSHKRRCEAPRDCECGSCRAGS